MTRGPRQLLLPLLAALLLLGGCGGSDSDDGTETSAATSDSTSPPTTTDSPSEPSADIPAPSGKGGVELTYDGTPLEDSAWTATCRDVGDGSVDLNAVGTRPNTVQGAIADGKVTRLIISTEPVLAQLDGAAAAAVQVKQLPSGYSLKGTYDDAGQKKPFMIVYTCGKP